MGSNPSAAQAEQRFLDAVQEIKTGQEESIDNILSRAYYVTDFSPCFSYFEVQKLYYKYPTQVKALTNKSIDYLVSQKDPKMVQTCISLLSRIIPSLALSVVDQDDFNSLFVGENSVITNLFTKLKSILFAPFILNQEEADDQLLWFWGTQLRSKVEAARTDALYLLFFAHDGIFFFPQNQEVQQQNKRLACIDSNIAKYLMNSIAEGVWWHNVHFLRMALPYSSIAMIDDESFKEALKGSNLMERLTDLTYVLVDDYNVYVHYTYSITSIEIDLIILSFICLLTEPKIEYNVQKMAISSIRFLQLANELDTKSIVQNHRLALSLLTIISSSKANGKKLEEQMIATELGTEYKFRTDSISLAILEAITNTILLVRPETSYILSLISSVIHNISPFITDYSYAPSLFSKLFDFSLNQVKENTNFFDSLVVSIERYVNGDIKDEADKDGQLKRKELNDVFSNLDVFQNTENANLKQKMLAAIQTDNIRNDYPLVINQVDSHLAWVKLFVFKLFEQRNKFSLDKIRKKQNKKKQTK